MPSEEAPAIAEKLLYLVAGSLLTLVGAIVKTWLDRRTHSSNRIFELRVEALNRVWQAFNEMKGLFAIRIEIGFGRWSQDYAQKAAEALATFRRSIDNAQVVLPAEVIDVLRRMDELYYLYLGDDQQRPSNFNRELKRLLGELTTAANNTLAKQTHLVKLQFRT